MTDFIHTANMLTLLIPHQLSGESNAFIESVEELHATIANDPTAFCELLLGFANWIDDLAEQNGFATPDERIAYFFRILAEEAAIAAQEN